MKLTFTLIVLCFSVLLMAQQRPGTPDSSFGIQGKVQSIFQTYNRAESVMIESDQKIIVAGECDSGAIVARYTTSGNIDSSFGINGSFISSTLQLQPQNKVTAALMNDEIFVAGTFNNQLRVIKLLNNGMPDYSFGNNGVASIQTAGTSSTQNIVLQTDGKIAVVSNNDNGYGIGVARFLATGGPDSAFGINGLTGIQIPDSYSNANAIAVTPDNKIVIVGACYIDYAAFLIARFTSNGYLDSSFNHIGYDLSTPGTGGDFPYPEGAYACAVQPDGKILSAGTATISNLHGIGFGILRYNTDGSLDGSFARGGVLELNVNNGGSACNAIALQKDGKILAAGAQNTNFLLTRFLSSGITDTTFGVNNYTTSTDFGNDDAASAIALTAEGKIVLAGGFSDAYGYGSTSNIEIARYNNDELSKKQIIIKKIKHYIQTHNDAQATTLNNVSIYPNPAQNILHVGGLPSTPAKLTVVDFNGNVIVSRELSVVSNGYDLNVSSLHAGNYLLKIETNGAIVTKQFVKQ